MSKPKTRKRPSWGLNVSYALLFLEGLKTGQTPRGEGGCPLACFGRGPVVFRPNHLPKRIGHRKHLDPKLGRWDELLAFVALEYIVMSERMCLRLLWLWLKLCLQLGRCDIPYEITLLVPLFSSFLRFFVSSSLPLFLSSSLPLFLSSSLPCWNQLLIILQ